jgi:hypothetical protein
MTPHLVDSPVISSWVAYVEGRVVGQNGTVRLLVDASDYPGDTGYIV